MENAEVTKPKVAAPSAGEALIRSYGAITVRKLKDLIDIEDPENMPAFVYVADLDANAVYWGNAEKHVEDLVDDDVLVVSVLDLKPGKYQWQNAIFVPVRKTSVRFDKSAPTMEQAFSALLTGLADDNVKLPTRCREWQNWYAKTIDS